MSSIGILGAGTWGVALARLLTNCRHHVMVWSAIPEEIRELAETRRHRNLPDVVIPDAVEFTDDLQIACKGRDILFFAVPSVYIRSTARAAAEYINNTPIIVSVAKGIEPDTLLSMTKIIRDEFEKKGKADFSYAVLSGPTHAEEVSRDMPTAIVSACRDMNVAGVIQNLFIKSCMRVYTNTDVEGVELCGALKNIIALAAGIARGLGYGDNTNAAIITRGMAEIRRLGTAMGCQEQTFSGLAGYGDLVVTATSQHSRNNRFGTMIGKGIRPEEAMRNIGMVVEGVNCLSSARQLAKKYHVEMPIVDAVYKVLFEGVSPGDALKSLMGRPNNTEAEKSVPQIEYESLLLQNRRGTGMKRVITYGTYDLLHYGHINLLRRAKALGDYLIVALSTDEFNWQEKHKKTYFTYEQRKQLLESIRYVDLVIPENNWQQKKTDIHEYHIDTFVMGDDWEGKFDFLKDEGTEVVYLPRTPEISSSQIKKDLYDANAVDGNSRLNHDDIDTNPA